MWQEILRRLGARGETHVAAAVNVGRPNATTQVVSVMTDEPNEKERVTEEELDQQEAEPLPERTQMSVLEPPGGITILPIPPDEM